MKVPIIWLKDYLDIKKSPQEIAESFTKLGLMLDKPIQDNVLDLEHRGNRSDWVSILGCARDLAAYEGLKLKAPKIKSINGKALKDKEKILIKVEAKKAVNRFNTRVFKNIEVKESPSWLKQRLKVYGIEPKNNIVDITNFVMVELGQPMHAQDLNKFSKKEITIRYAKKGESLTTILGKKVKLDPKTFILAQDNKPIAIGGIVGGKKTSITKGTKQIILDAGNYDQKTIRKTSRRLNIQNETVTRYDKFLDPRLTEVALNRATELIQELAEGEYYKNIDWYPKKTQPQTQKLSFARIKKISGTTFKPNKIKHILLSLGYEIIEKTNDYLTVEVPIFRTDIQVEDDLISDILRISDYDNIPSQKISFPPPKEITPEIYRFEQELKNTLTQLGLHEHITEPLIEKTGNKNEVILENALTSEKSALRTSIEQTLKKVTHTYKKHKIPEAMIFEIGKTYQKTKPQKTIESFKEERMLTVIYKNFNKDLKFESKKTRSILSSVLENLGISNYELMQDKQLDQASIIVSKEKIGNLKTNSFNLKTKRLLENKLEKTHILSKFKHLQKEDISIITSSKSPFGPIYQHIKKTPKLTNLSIKEEYSGKEIPKNKKAFLLELTFQKNANTNELKKKLLKELKEKFKIQTRTNN